MVLMSHDPAYISRVMIFIDGHYFEKNIKSKNNGEIIYSQPARHLIRHSNFGTPALTRVYFYDGSPDPEQKFDFLDEHEQTLRRKEIVNQYKKKKEHFDKIAMLEFFEVRKGKAVYNKIFNKKGKVE